MKLLFYTSEEDCPSEYLTDEYVIISRAPILNAKHNFNIEHFPLPIEDIRDAAEKYRENILADKLYAPYYDTVSSNFTSFYNVICLHIYKWFNTYEHIKHKYTFEEILIFEGIPNNNFTPFYGAEGVEVNVKLFYKTYDFIPSLIHKSFTENNINVKIIHKKSRFGFYRRVFLRRIGLLHLKTAILFSKKVKSKKPIINPKLLFLSRGIAHTHYILPYIKKYGDSGLLITDGYYSKGSNYKYCIENNIPTLQGEYFLKGLDIIKNYLRALQKIFALTFRVNFPDFIFKKMQLNMHSIMKEFIIYSYDGKIYESILDNYLKKNNSNLEVIITGEMITLFPFYVNRAAKKYKKKNLQLQTTLMAHIPQTKFVYCDKFLCKSHKDKVKNIELNPIDHSKYEFWGIISDPEEKKSNIDRNKLKTILFYTQPIEKEDEIEIIETLISYAKENQITFFLKPHPRDKEDYISLFEGRLEILPKDLHIDNYIEKIDLVVMRNSSIAQEVILKNKVIIFCLFSEKFSKTKSAHIKRDYPGICYKQSELLPLISSYVQLGKSFYSFRNEIIKDLSLDKDISFFDKNLRGFLNMEKHKPEKAQS